MSIRFDDDQLRAVRVTRNAVITAGAGSGKTSVLVERYCWLLAEKGAAVEEILALTFTRKAAAEMYERIYGRLRDSPHPHVRHQLRHFERAQISTLDSFCSQVVRNASQMFGLAPDFRYDEEEVRRAAERASLDYILANLDDPALQAFIDLYGFETVREDLFMELALKELHLAEETNFSALGRRQLETCRRLLAGHLDAFLKAAQGVKSLEPRTASIRRAQEEAAGAAGWPALAGAGRYAEVAEACRSLALKKPGGRAAPDIQELKSYLHRLQEEQKLIAALAETLAREELLTSAFSHLDLFQADFNRRKRASGLVSFRDIAEMSIRVLGENKPLRRFFKSRFRYIMIDEFQDNNRLQKDLLYLLSERQDLCGDGVPDADSLEEGKLFFVGDEKQSIYRFRGADVGVFKDLSRELEARGGELVALNRNYRSTPGLIAFFNRVFSVLMAEAEESYEARFQELEPGRDADGSGGGAPERSEIRLLYRPYHREEPEGFLSREESEAFAVAGYILEAVAGRRLTVRGEAGGRPAGYDDFAVLLRSTGNQIIYERMFRHLRIPYSTQNMRSLYLEAPLNDIYHLLRLCLWPEDRLSTAAVLRSPFVNLSDQALLQVLGSGRPPFGEPAAAGAGAAAAAAADPEQPSLNAEDRERLVRGGELLRELRARVDTLPLTEVFTRLWYENGYRYFVLQDPRYHNYLEFFDAMTALARAADRRADNLSAFLDYLRPRLGTAEKAAEADSRGSGQEGVRLMTIHKAKGLEFPVVILADTGNRGRNREAGHPYTVTDELGITLNPSGEGYFFLRGKEEREKKEIAELKRLFYVALTRARSHLVISGSHNSGNRQTPKALLNLLFTGLQLDPEAAPEGDQEGGYSLKHIPVVSEEAFRRRPPPPRRAFPDLESLRAGYAGAALIRRPPGPRREYTVTELSALLTETAAPAAAGAPVELPALEVDPLLRAEGLESNFGSLVHSLLAACFGGPAGEEFEPDWLELGIPPRFRAACLASARELRDRFLSSPLGKLTAQAAAAGEIRAELPFVRRTGGFLVNGQIDLLICCGERSLLVDFKSDRVLRQEEYMAQLGLYRLAARELVGRDPECSIFLLRSGESLPLDTSVDWEAKLLRLLASLDAASAAKGD